MFVEKPLYNTACFLSCVILRFTSGAHHGSPAFSIHRLADHVTIIVLGLEVGINCEIQLISDAFGKSN